MQRRHLQQLIALLLCGAMAHAVQAQGEPHISCLHSRRSIQYSIANTQPNTLTNPKPNAFAQPLTDPQSYPHPYTLANAFSHTKSNSKPHPQPQTFTDTVSFTKPHAQPNSQSNAQSNAQPHAHAYSQPHAHTHTHSSGNSEPFDTSKAETLINGFTTTMTTVSPANINVLNIAKAVATRRLLQSTSDTAAVVQVQMTGSTENSTAQIAQELGSIVSNNALQNYLYAHNLQLSVLKVLSTTESVPNAYTVTCPNGAVESVCIGSSGASLPRSTIIAIAVGVAGGVVLVGIIVLLSMLWCMKRRRAAKEATGMKPTPKAMTPSAAYPYFDAKPMQFRGVKVRATPAEGSPYPKAYSPKVQNPQQPFGRAPVQELTGTGPPPPRAKGKEPARALPDPAQEHVITGEEVAEHIEMGGRAAREKLAMKLPKFGQPQTVRPARRTDSLLNEIITKAGGTPPKLDSTPEDSEGPSSHQREEPSSSRD
ncbi:hypothetical protein CVIRNUC_010074 [Coccomyxa viridis]|uniref:Uncharacterized protein n=1 Tax=Coccomyxa viridis TaxID=1274662 RepID=A0AAV1ILD2_9CHLO|nr:hypothetical protein CVIRNUC_010074 [Coccomyxa viridis]